MEDRLGVSLRHDLHFMIYIKHQIGSLLVDNRSLTNLSKSTKIYMP